MNTFRCLAIETATNFSSVAVCDGEQTAQLQLQDSRTSSRQLYQSVKTVLTEVGLQLADLDCIAFGCGPGSFTGVRVAASGAQALAYSLNVPVCRVSTLRALAAVARRQSDCTEIAVCVDARMGEVYAGLYSGKEIVECQPDRLVQPDDYRLNELQSEGWLAVGNGWQEFPDMLAANKANIAGSIDYVWPDALAVLAIAGEMFAMGESISAGNALPNYLRNQVTQ